MVLRLIGFIPDSVIATLRWQGQTTDVYGFGNCAKVLRLQKISGAVILVIFLYEHEWFGFITVDAKVFSLIVLFCGIFHHFLDGNVLGLLFVEHLAQFTLLARALGLRAKGLADLDVGKRRGHTCINRACE